MLLRIVLIVFVLAANSGAFAQGSGELDRASRALAALWRPVPGPLTEASISQTCGGAAQEIAAIEAALPANLDYRESIQQVRGLRGLLIVPDAEDHAWAFFFPPATLPWFTPGLGSIRVVSEEEGFIVIRDATDLEIAIQLGRAGDHRVMRIRPPDAPPLTFVACAPVG